MSYWDVFCDEQDESPPNIECPKCNGHNTHAIYRPEVYEFDHWCRDCDKGFNELRQRLV